MCHTKDYKLGICCFSAKHLALKRKNKDWLVHNQDNVLATNLIISYEGGKDRIEVPVFNIFWIFVYYKCILSIGNPKMKSSHVNVLR
jgi:hypothetical protein